MTKKVPKKILRIERNFFVNLRKKCFLAAHAAAPRRRRRFFWTSGAPPPPTEIDRRAAADTMTSAHSSSVKVCRFGKACRTRSSSRRETVPKTAAGVAEVSLILCFIWAIRHIHTISLELEKVSNWAASNNLRLNADKSKELVIPKRSRSFDPLNLFLEWNV